jgi:hypothetical protein
MTLCAATIPRLVAARAQLPRHSQCYAERQNSLAPNALTSPASPFRLFWARSLNTLLLGRLVGAFSP